MKLTKALEAKLRENSKDKRIFDSLYEVTKFFLERDVKTLTIGSCAILSHLEYIYRLPNDIDLVINEKAFNSLANDLKKTFQIERKTGYYQFFLNKFKVHLVIESLKIIDFKTKTPFTTINLNLPEEFTYKKNIVSRFYNKNIDITTPLIEICFLLNILGPLNTHTIEDTKTILDNISLNISVIDNFLKSQNNNDIIEVLIEERIAQLCSVFKQSANAKDESYMAQLFDIAECLNL